MASEVVGLLRATAQTTQQLNVAVQTAVQSNQDALRLLRGVRKNVHIIGGALELRLDSDSDHLHAAFIAIIGRVAGSLTAARDAIYAHLLKKKLAALFGASGIEETLRVSARELSCALRELGSAFDRQLLSEQAKGAEGAGKVLRLPPEVEEQLYNLGHAACLRGGTSKEVLSIVARLAVGEAKQQRAALKELEGMLDREGLLGYNSFVKAGGVAALAQLCISGRTEVREHAAQVLRHLLFSPDYPAGAGRREFLAAVGVVPFLMQQLACPNYGPRAAQSLSELAFMGGSSTSAEIVDAGGAPALVGLLRGASAEDRRQAAQALATLVRERGSRSSCGRRVHDAVVAAGGIPALLGLLEERGSTGSGEGSGEGSVAAAAARALRNLAWGRQQGTEAAMLHAGGVKALVKLLQRGSSREQALAASTLGELAACSAASRDAVAAEGGIEALVQLLQSPSAAAGESVASEVLAAVNALEDLAQGSCNMQRAVAAEGGMPALRGLMRSNSAVLRARAAEVLACLHQP